MNVAEANTFEPILIVDIGRILFIGEVERVPQHTPMVPIVGAGLDGAVAIEIDGAILEGRSVVVPAGVTRGVNAFGKRLAVMPIDPVEMPAGVVDENRLLAELDSLSEGYDAGAWNASGVAAGLHPVSGDRPDTVWQAMERLAESADENVSGTLIAAEVGLSLSRLQHLFQDTVGTSMRSFRTWHRLRRVAAARKDGATLTVAAHHAGFFDSAHFTNTFTRTFGVTPSFVFSDNLRIELAG